MEGEKGVEGGKCGSHPLPIRKRGPRARSQWQPVGGVKSVSGRVRHPILTCERVGEPHVNDSLRGGVNSVKGVAFAADGPEWRASKHAPAYRPLPHTHPHFACAPTLAHPQIHTCRAAMQSWTSLVPMLPGRDTSAS